MVFTSFNFLIFFPVVVILYYLTPVKYRWALLLAASYFLYINVKPVYALLLAGVTLSTWFFTKLIDGTPDDKIKRRYMITNIVLVLFPLFFFKYFGVINNGLIQFMDNAGMRWPLPEIKLLLPVGISFYTFVAIGYTIDVYNEEVPAEKNLGITALFISFFPLILSGPIERAKNLLPQFNNAKNATYEMVAKGLKLMLWGYFMKLVVADRLGTYVDAVYNSIPLHNGTSILLAVVLYPFQVYADLGGYSLIAIGTAKILGINVMDNFKRPFFATSMAEFWRRWHISLITWLTDYVYTPLSFGFRKYKTWGIVLALMVTFIISGIWHGAAITFIIWGVLQGIYVSVEALTVKNKTNFEKKYNLSKNVFYIFISCVITFILFASSQIFARSSDTDTALKVYQKIFTAPGPLFIGVPSALIFSFAGLFMLFFKDFTDEYTPLKFRLFESKYKAVRILSYSLVIIIILLIGVFDSSEFIYFQF
jgi:alginate O-acetyltransferase complex protein AlgI